MTESAGKTRGAYSSLKRVYTIARNLPDRVLHRRRRSEARQRVLRLHPVSSIIVVCYGNVCRSPYLEAVLRHALPGVQVSSAGFVGPGRAVPTHSLTLAGQRGIDLAGFRSRPLSHANVAGADLVIVMDAGQARHISQMYRVSSTRIVIAGDLDPVVSPTRAIHDPWGQSAEVFASSFNRLDRCAATLVSLVRQSHRAH